MKVVRPEWLIESAGAGVLLPWRDFIFDPSHRLENAQGSKPKQLNLLDRSQHALSIISLATVNDSPKANQELVIQPTTPTRAPTHAPNVANLPSVIPKKAIKELPKYAAHTSNPLATRVMANPDWRKAHTSVAADFIEGYYKNSRLHHLSTWKAELKNLVQEAQERAEAGGVGELVGRVDSEAVGVIEGVSMRGAELVMKSPGKGKGKEKAVDDRVIMHCDFDCFFVSAGLLSRSHLKGKPVVVCHSQGAQGGASSTSEIASSSYEARKFGIKNGMRYAIGISFPVLLNQTFVKPPTSSKTMPHYHYDSL